MKTLSRGFSLVELAITILVLGMLFAFSIPAYRNISATYQLKGATENIAAQLRLAREKAIATGSGQQIHFTPNYMNCDYHIHYPSGHVIPLGKLGRGISFASISLHPLLERDGRVYSSPGVPASGTVILRDARGNRDTVSMQASGLVLTK
jgi:prepilin-type N-terminal cleavage/methylation domain-containing protein